MLCGVCSPKTLALQHIYHMPLEVQEVSLNLYSGQIFCLLGHNGAGGVSKLYGKMVKGQGVFPWVLSIWYFNSPKKTPNPPVVETILLLLAHCHWFQIHFVWKCEVDTLPMHWAENGGRLTLVTKWLDDTYTCSLLLPEPPYDLRQGRPPRSTCWVACCRYLQAPMARWNWDSCWCREAVIFEQIVYQDVGSSLWSVRFG